MYEFQCSILLNSKYENTLLEHIFCENSIKQILDQIIKLQIDGYKCSQPEFFVERIYFKIYFNDTF